MNIYVKKRIHHLYIIALVFLMSFAPSPSQARMTGNTLIVRNDPGGSVRQRFYQIRKLIANDTKIEIRDGYCFSACTMYIGLPNTCVGADANFGFHGPYRFMERLSKEQFDDWSRFIANYYPAPIRKWYLEKGRNKSYGYYKISGKELIRLGVKKCEPSEGLAEVP